MSNFVSVEKDGEIITYELASFWHRLAARIIDVLIIYLPSVIIPIIPGWLYWAFLQSSERQATIGQRALSIKVIDINGDKVSFGQATGRFFGNFLNLLTLLGGYIMFFFHDKNQCLHDLISGCLVVKDVEIERIDDITRHLVE